MFSTQTLSQAPKHKQHTKLKTKHKGWIRILKTGGK